MLVMFSSTIVRDHVERIISVYSNPPARTHLRRRDAELGAVCNKRGFGVSSVNVVIPVRNSRRRHVMWNSVHDVDFG